MKNPEKAAGAAPSVPSMSTPRTSGERLAAKGRYAIECFGSDGKLKWRDIIDNLVTTQGRNDLLDKYLAGSAYTAAWHYGLISSVSYSSITSGDTAAQINGTNGWKEAGPSNAPNYTETTRPALTFTSASGGTKATSSGSTFTISGSGTVKGAFAVSSSTKDGTSGVLLSAGFLAGGDRAVLSGDVLSLSYSLSV